MFVGWFAKLCNVFGRGGSMYKRAIERQLIGGILELTTDSKLFYRSDIGKQHEYSRWTEAGQEALQAFVEDYTRKLLVAQDLELNERAKDMVLKTLKDKNT